MLLLVSWWLGTRRGRTFHFQEPNCGSVQVLPIQRRVFPLCTMESRFISTSYWAVCFQLCVDFLKDQPWWFRCAQLWPVLQHLWSLLSISASGQSVSVALRAAHLSYCCVWDSPQYLRSTPSSRRFWTEWEHWDRTDSFCSLLQWKNCSEVHCLTFCPTSITLFWGSSFIYVYNCSRKDNTRRPCRTRAQSQSSGLHSLKFLRVLY